LPSKWVTLSKQLYFLMFHLLPSPFFDLFSGQTTIYTGQLGSNSSLISAKLIWSSFNQQRCCD
jgi:hypothetical protein